MKPGNDSAGLLLQKLNLLTLEFSGNRSSASVFEVYRTGAGMFSRFVWSGVYVAICGVWLFFVMVATAQPLHAYVDPGSGLLFIQAAGSTLAGIGYLLRKRIREIFRRLARRSAESQ